DPAGHEPTGLLEDPLNDGDERIGQRRANDDGVDEMSGERVLRLKQTGHAASPRRVWRQRGWQDHGERPDHGAKLTGEDGGSNRSRLERGHRWLILYVARARGFCALTRSRSACTWGVSVRLNCALRASMLAVSSDCARNGLCAPNDRSAFP